MVPWRQRKILLSQYSDIRRFIQSHDSAQPIRGRDRPVTSSCFQILSKGAKCLTLMSKMNKMWHAEINKWTMPWKRLLLHLKKKQLLHLLPQRSAVGISATLSTSWNAVPSLSKVNVQTIRQRDGARPVQRLSLRRCEKRTCISKENIIDEHSEREIVVTGDSEGNIIVQEVGLTFNLKECMQ